MPNPNYDVFYDAPMPTVTPEIAADFKEMIGSSYNKINNFIRENPNKAWPFFKGLYNLDPTKTMQYFAQDNVIHNLTFSGGSQNRDEVWQTFTSLSDSWQICSMLRGDLAVEALIYCTHAPMSYHEKAARLWKGIAKLENPDQKQAIFFAKGTFDALTLHGVPRSEIMRTMSPILLETRSMSGKPIHLGRMDLVNS